MSDLTLTTQTRIISAIVDLVLAQDRYPADGKGSLILTPADPIPARRLVCDPDPRWEVDGPIFDKSQRVANWGWLRRQAHGYSDPGLVHPLVGTAFYVRQWRYGKGQRAGGYVPHERFDPIFIARLSDGRIFAEQWADPSVLHDALSRWRNARGYLCDWDPFGTYSPETCAIGGLDWAAIPDMIDGHRARLMRERGLAAT